VFYCILKIGSKSFSHLLAVLERYQKLLMLKTSSSAEEKLCIIRVASLIWEKSPQHFMILIERLLTSRIIDSQSVVQWVFSENEAMRFTRSFLWDIIRCVIRRELHKNEILKERLEKECQKELQSEEDTRQKLLELKSAQEQQLNDQKKLFLTLFQRFFEFASLQSERGDQFWRHYTLGHFKEIGRKYAEQIVENAELEKIINSTYTLLKPKNK